MRSTTSGSISIAHNSTPPMTRPAYGFTALVEGDATGSTQAYLDSLSSTERAEVAKELRDLGLAHPEIFTLPQVLRDIIQAPYEDGSTLVKAILEAGSANASTRHSSSHRRRASR